MNWSREPHHLALQGAAVDGHVSHTINALEGVFGQRLAEAELQSAHATPLAGGDVFHGNEAAVADDGDPIAEAPPPRE